jgi:hypothetical protein
MHGDQDDSENEFITATNKTKDVEEDLKSFRKFKKKTVRRKGAKAKKSRTVRNLFGKKSDGFLF